MTQKKFDGRVGRSSQFGTIPGVSERGLDDEVRETGGSLQTFKVKIELDTTDVEKVIAEVNKRFGDFIKTLKVDEPVYRVVFYKKSGGVIEGFQPNEMIYPQSSFFIAKVTPELEGKVLVAADEVSCVILMPYRPEKKTSAA
ncbi:TPA: hypothetical protein MFM99_002346 [Klebsiella pneumoniae]|uniref:hypothetical protein n=1 Tax=Klebsiella pneumoniae complex TaxID=3390273 RepID=UPI0024BECBE4|nr:hypothetical protein [Klebsiella quasipneumoniae]HBW8709209.1 hypothetical protein [Klebsiella pneumoniae]